MYKVAYSSSVAGETTIQSHAEQGDSVFGTLGRHVIADLSGCVKELLSLREYVQNVVEEAVRKAGATIITSRFHNFSPIGVSGIVLLSESHASIHTWPEEGYASIDIYTCGDHVFPQVAYEYIARKLKAMAVHLTVLERGLDSPVKVGGNKTFYKHKVTISEEPVCSE